MNRSVVALARRLEINKARALNNQRIQNELNFNALLDFVRWASVAAASTLMLVLGCLFLLRFAIAADNALNGRLLIPTRLNLLNQHERLILRQNTLPLLTPPTAETDAEPVPTTDDGTAREHGTRNAEHGNTPARTAREQREHPALIREGERVRVRASAVSDILQIGDVQLSRAEYLRFSKALDSGRETKSAIAKRLPGRYQTNLQKLNAIIAHRQR